MSRVKPPGAGGPLQLTIFLLSRLYEFGVTKAIGSMAGACLSSKEDFVSPVGKGAVRQATVTPLFGSKPHAFFYDVTHDNETPLDKRTAEDALPTGALVTFTSAAIGSTKGFDDLYPKLLNLVSDNRKYEISSPEQENGIGKVKRVLNNLHRELASGGYVEGHVHQENDVSKEPSGGQKVVTHYHLRLTVHRYASGPPFVAQRILVGGSHCLQQGRFGPW